MTDRIHSLTVVLEHNMRDDDVKCVTEAIAMIKCVQEVVPQVASGETYMAESRARQDWVDMLFDLTWVSRDIKKLKRVRALLKELRDA